MDVYEIKGYTIEYIDSIHCYICNGIILPSVTTILGIKFGNKYKDVDEAVLKRAAQNGTEVHNAIERYCKEGIESDLQEVKNFKFLKKQYNFEVLDNEVPILIFKDDVPVAVGRLDLVLSDGENIGLGDIKRTSTLDKEYLAYQLNFYRIGYKQSYGKDISFLKGIHLRENTRKYVNIPINEEMALELLNKYLEKNGETKDE